MNFQSELFKKLDKKLIYISEGNIPSLAANSMQVMKMSQAFAEVVASFELLTLGDLSSWLLKKKFNFATWYGLHHKFRITRLPLLMRSSYPFPANYRLPAFPKCAAWYACERQADVIYTRSEDAAWYAFRRGKRVLLETHSPASANIWYLRLNHKVADKFLGIVTISPVLAESYILRGLPREKVIVAFDGVDLERFGQNLSKETARSKVGLPLDLKVAAYVGQLYENRGIEEIYHCAREMADVLFILVGGWDTDVRRRRQEIEQLRLPNVHIVGFVPNAQVPLYLAASDVLLMPYSEQVSTVHWMSPMKMFEYMAANRPIVAPNLAAVKQVLQDNRNGVLVAPDNAKALSSAIRLLLDNDTFAERLACQAYQDVQGYTWLKRANRVLTHFQLETS